MCTVRTTFMRDPPGAPQVYLPVGYSYLMHKQYMYKSRYYTDFHIFARSNYT